MNSYRGPELLTADHDIDEFDCGDESLNNWLRQHALRNQGVGSSRTWVIVNGKGLVVAYYASSAASLERELATRRIRHNQPELLPAMLLGRLAVDRNQQGHGLAAALLKHFLLKALDVAELTGLRVVLVHAKNNQVADFYRRFGFQSAPVDDLTLMMLIQDIRETIEA